RRRRGEAVAVEVARAGPRDGRDVAGRVDLPDAVVVEVGDVEIAGRIHLEPGRARDLRGGRRAVVAREPGDARADDRVDRTARVDRADALVLRVGEDDVAGLVHDDVGRAVEPDDGRGHAVDAEGRRAVARDRGDRAGRRVDLADAIVAAVGDEEV